jgi:dihydrofolate reductase
LCHELCVSSHHSLCQQKHPLSREHSREPFILLKGKTAKIGSSTLYPQLLEGNLIDRLLLLTCPTVLGKSKRLFGSTSHPVNMKLVKNDISSTGVIMATYEHEG